MNMVDFSVRRPVFITMVIVGMVLIGAILLPGLPVDLMPDMELPVAVVVTSYPGASPEVVESMVTKPIEDMVGTLNRVDTVESISQTGSSLVVVMFDWGTDMDKAQLDLQKQVNRIKAMLPDGANEPLVLQIDPNSMPVMMLGLSGERPLEELQAIAEDQIEPALRKVDGVASVAIAGGLTEEIQVVLDPDKLTEYGLTPGYVAQQLAGNNLLASSGSVERGSQELAIRFDAQLSSLEDVQQVQIALPAGGSIQLSHLADVKLNFAEQTQYAYLNGEPFVQLNVMKTSGGNTVNVSKGVKEELERLAAALPEGVTLQTVYDTADYINASIRNVVEHGLLGGIIAIIILYLFLGSWRTTLVVGLMLPVSVIATFTFMAAAGESINLLSLGGLLIGMGSLVDFAIVVIESIHRHRMSGKQGAEAATIGAKEVTAAVTASALAQISVFFPMLFAGGLATVLFGPMALAVIFSHVAAWFGAITFVPMLASRFLGKAGLPGHEEPGADTAEGTGGRRVRRFRPAARFQHAIARLEMVYRRILRWSLNHRWTVVIVSFVLLIGSFALVPVIGAEFIPESDGGQASVSVTLPPSTKLDETLQVVRQLEAILLDFPEVDMVASSVGGTPNTELTGITSSNTATVYVMMKPLEERERSTQQVMNDFREQARHIPGIELSINTDMMAAGGSGLQLNVTAQDPEMLEELNDELVSILENVPGVASVESSMEAARPEVAVYLDRQKAAVYGISPAEVQTAVQAAFGGKTVTVVRDGEDELDVRLMLPPEYKLEYANLENLTLRTSTGALVSLGDVAEVVTEGAPISIARSEGQRQLRLTFQLTGERPLGEVMAAIAQTMQGVSLPKGVEWNMGGEAEQMAESFQSLAIAIVLAILLIYMIMAAQFESFFQPFVIMFCLPPTFVGAILGLFTHGIPVSVTALIGLLMLIGIVMNNAIVLVDYTNQLRRAGYGRDEALLAAGPVRLRPILMTMLTTNLVLVPFAYFGGESSETMRPLAVVVIYGLLVSTLITLVLVPAVYSLAEGFFTRLRGRLRKAFRRRRDDGTPDSQASLPEPAAAARQVAAAEETGEAGADADGTRSGKTSTGKEDEDETRT
nr:AcrB/AcrD/AcrF family protein [Bacillota bacterium]